LSTDEGGTFQTRIEALDSARVEDIVREYFANADEVGFQCIVFVIYALLLQLNVKFVSGINLIFC